MLFRSDMAFQKAGRLALRDAVDKAQPMLLEPVDDVSILVPDDYVGAVMSDLSGRRGRVLGTQPIEAIVDHLRLIGFGFGRRSFLYSRRGRDGQQRGDLLQPARPPYLLPKVRSEDRPRARCSLPEVHAPGAHGARGHTALAACARARLAGAVALCACDRQVSQYPVGRAARSVGALPAGERFSGGAA